MEYLKNGVSGLGGSHQFVQNGGCDLRRRQSALEMGRGEGEGRGEERERGEERVRESEERET